MKLTIHFHLVPRLMRGAISPFSQYVFMAWCLDKSQEQLNNIKLFYYLFTYWQSFRKFYSHQIMVSMTCVKDWSSATIKCCFLSIETWSKTWSSSSCVFRSGEVEVYLWVLRCENILLFTFRFFYVAKFGTVTPLSLLTSCKLSLPVVG
jgi:hypothetical protein